jgi:hypothetical protein
MARYLYRCADGAPHGYIDEEGGTDPMLYTLDGRWLGYVSADGGNVFSPSGQPVFYIADNYFCDASGPVLYCEKKAPEKMRREVHESLWRCCEMIGIEPIDFSDRQIEIIQSRMPWNALDHTQYFSRVVEQLREPPIDDAAVRRAAERAQAEFGE